MFDSWETVESELARMSAAPGRVTELADDGTQFEDVRRRARLARAAGFPPPAKVIPSACGRGLALVWKGGVAIGAAV